MRKKSSWLVVRLSPLSAFKLAIRDSLWKMIVENFKTTSKHHQLALEVSTIWWIYAMILRNVHIQAHAAQTTIELTFHLKINAENMHSTLDSHLQSLSIFLARQRIQQPYCLSNKLKYRTWRQDNPVCIVKLLSEVPIKSSTTHLQCYIIYHI